MNYKYQIFGSKDSQDVDIMVFVDELKTIDENHTLIKELNKHFETIYPGREINCNLGILKDGMMVDVFKGTYDECNNSLYYTYDLHQQPGENVIDRLYVRGRGTDFYHLKLKRVARFILSFFSREPELRSIIKPALKGDLIVRLSALEKIDFHKYTTFPGKKEKHEDIYKVLAFQFSQCMCLASYKEVYTKEDAKIFKQFSNMLDRKPITETDLEILNRCKEIFIVLCDTEISKGKMLNFEE